MKANFVIFTNNNFNPLMAYTSAKAYLKYKNIDIDFHRTILYCERRNEDNDLHTNYTDYTTEYIFGKTVDDIVDLESVVKLFRNYDLGYDLLKDIHIPKFRKDKLIKSINKEAKRLSTYDVVFFSVFRYHFLYHLYLAALIKTLNIDIQLIFGGPQIINSKLSVKLLDESTFIDNIIIGDVETGIYDYFMTPIERLHYPKQLDLKEQQKPDYDNQPLFLFQDQIMVSSSRNCFNNCSYCPSVYLSYNMVPIDIFSNWIQDFCKDTKIKSIYFTDAIFNPTFERFDAILDVLLEYANKLSFWCHSIGLNSNHIDKLVKLNFDDPGCIVLAYDSASVELNKLMKRKSSQDIDKLIDEMINKGLNLYTPFIQGLPIETENDYLLTYNKVKQLRMMYGKNIIIAIHSFLFIPGSPFYENYKDYNIKLEYWDEKTAMIYPPARDVVLTIPRYYYGILDVTTFNKRIESYNEWRIR